MSDTPEQRQQTRRLVRRTDRKMIGGVAAGLGEYFGLDPMLFRVGFVVFAVLGFGGVLIYLLAWALIPAHDRPSTASRAAVGRWTGIALVVVGAVMIVPALLALATGGFFFDGFYGSWRDSGPLGPSGPRGPLGVGLGPLFVAGALVATGAILLRRPNPPDPAPPEAPVTPARGEDFPAAIPRAPRSPLPVFTLAAMSLGLGTAAALGNLGVIELDVGQYAALALALLGAGILAGAWWGRARILIVLGVLMVPCVLAASLIDVPLEGDVGSHYVMAHSAADITPREILFGDLTIDLTQFPFEEGPQPELDIRFGAGEVTVMVPRGVYVDASVQTRLGEVFVLDSYDDGIDVDLHVTDGPATSSRRLEVDISGGLGAVHIRRVRGFVPPPQPGSGAPRRDDRKEPRKR